MGAALDRYKLSFIIIGRNEGWKLSLCLESVNRCIENNSILNYEIIYVDSQSTDNSIEIAKSHNVTKVFSVSGQTSPAISRNIGGRESQGDILVFLDGDMELQSDFIPMLQKKDGTLIYPFVSGMISHSYYDKKWNFIKTKISNPISDNTFCPNASGFYLITKRLWEAVGGMDIRLDNNEDADLGIRMAQKGILLLRISKLCVFHHTIAYTDNTRFWSTIKRYRYVALFARKQFFRKYYWGTTLRMNYSSWLLALSLMGLIITSYSYLLYIVVLMFRSLSYGVKHFHKMFFFFY